MWGDIAMLVFLMYVSLTFGDECSQGGDIEMTQKVLKNVFQKLSETCLAIYKKYVSFFKNPTSYSGLGGQIEWEMGLTQILEQPYQNPKFPSEAFFEGLLWRVISPSTQIIGWSITYPWKAL